MDTPLAITALDGEMLQRQGVSDMAGLSNVIPNLTIGTEGARDATYIAIRGVSQNERRNVDDATTPFFIDGATVPRMSGVAAYFYDVERIEVLRGPQGTLYGRNSTTGVVNLITKKPDFEGVHGDLELSAGNYNMFTSHGAVNVPLSDTVAARFAFTTNNRDGYFKNGPLIDDSNDAGDYGVRGHLLWNISDETSLLFTADYYAKDAAGANSLAVPCPSDVVCDLGLNLRSSEGDIELNTQSFRDNSDTDFKIELNHSFENMDLTALTSWRKHERDYRSEGGWGEVFNGVPVESDVVEITESESISAEVRLTSTTDGPLQWILGAYMLDEEINGDFKFQPVFIGSPFIGNHLNLQFNDRGLTIESKAVFANITYDLSDALTFRGGIRYTDDEKDKGGIFSADPEVRRSGSHMIVGILEQPGVFFGPSVRSQVSNPGWTQTTFNVGLDWKINEDTMAYAKFSTGYKAGGFNRGSAGPGSDGMTGNFVLDVYDPEEVDAYEIGLKTSFADGRGRLSMAAFYNDYANKVESVVADIDGVPTNKAINATDVEIYGLEVEGSYLYSDQGGRVDFNWGYLDATYGDFPNLPDPVIAGGAVFDVSGNTLANAPEFNWTLSWVPIELNVMDGVLTPMVQIAYKSEYITRPHGLLNDQQDEFTRSNLSLHWESDNNGVYGELFVHNVEDELIQSASTCGGVAQGGRSVGCSKMFQAPRTFGVRAGYRF